jgi:hypothetical protein
MGASCSIEKEERSHEEKELPDLLSRSSHSKLIKRHHAQHPHERFTTAMAGSQGSTPVHQDEVTQYDLTEALDDVLLRKDRLPKPLLELGGYMEDKNEELETTVRRYSKARGEVQQREGALGFEWACQKPNDIPESLANAKLQAAKWLDMNDVYGKRKPKKEGGPEKGDAKKEDAEKERLMAEGKLAPELVDEYMMEKYLLEEDSDEEDDNEKSSTQGNRPPKPDPRKGYGGQRHPVFFGDHFLSNVEYIERTKLFKIAKAMPKAAHLHIHFNANLDPAFLLNIAYSQPRMFVTSDLPLISEANVDLCEIQFCIVSEANERDRDERDRDERERDGREVTGRRDIFSPKYDELTSEMLEEIESEVERWAREGKKTVEQRKRKLQRMIKKARKQLRRLMPIQDFIKKFGQEFLGIMLRRGQDLRERADEVKKQPAMQWLEDKLVFQEEEAYGVHQTPQGAWEKFNGRTRMMKGLFNYRTAYEKYTRRCLEEFLEDNILYAEIRPNFMDSNQVWKDDGTDKLDNAAIMELIIQEFEKFQQELERRSEVIRTGSGKEADRPKKKPCHFAGLKVIYCAPRSFDRPKVKKALDECRQFYENPRFRRHLAGFDLVGEEGAAKFPLKHFTDQFLEFRKEVRADEVPFLFHCGETIDIGTDTDGNLLDALLLGSKRIGHGFALPRHPYIMEQMKKNNVCIELCPISNEILGLTPRANGHSMYALLANNVHCTVNSDNPTLFR